MAKYRGYFGIGVWHTKTETNIGTLMRSAFCFGAAFVFTIGRRYPPRQCSDTTKAWRHIPLYHYDTIEEMPIPHSCVVVGIELDPRAKPLTEMCHPERAIYILGAEDHGMSKEIMERCHRLVYIPGGCLCLNVATAGSIVMYDRVTRGIT